MNRSEYQETIEHLLRQFNFFQYQAISYLENHPETRLRDQLMMWIHPKGLSNIINNITLHHQAELPHPEIFQQHQNIKVEENEPTLKTFSKKGLMKMAVSDSSAFTHSKALVKKEEEEEVPNNDGDDS